MSSRPSSVIVAHPCASCTLRWYWRFPSSDWRSAMARAAWYGSSDGREISLPDADFICSLLSLSETEFRSASTLRWSIEVVMRIVTARPFRCG